jgi:hypothetical protein
MANIAHGLHSTQWSFEMQYNNQSIAPLCRFANCMYINYVAYNTNTAMVGAKINLIKHQLYYAQEAYYIFQFNVF